MKQIDLSSMTKAELEKYALDTSRKLDEVSAELEYYRKMFRLSQAKRFGRKSEKSLIDDGQQECFFNEIEKEADLRLPEPKAEKACPVRKIKRKGKKDAFISSLRKTDPV